MVGSLSKRMRMGLVGSSRVWHCVQAPGDEYIGYNGVVALIPVARIEAGVDFVVLLLYDIQCFVARRFGHNVAAGVVETTDNIADLHQPAPLCYY